MDCGGGDRRGRALVHVRNNLHDPTPDKSLELVPGAVEDARAMLGPLVLRAGFLSAPERETQWRALLRRGRLAGPPDTARLADILRRFLGPVLSAASRGEAFERQ